MKPKEPVDLGQQEFFHSRLDRKVDMNDEFVIVAGYVNGDLLAEACGKAYSDKFGHQGLPTRLMVGLDLLKFDGKQSDEEVVAIWRLSPYYRDLCGDEFFCHDLPPDGSSMTRWHLCIGEEKMTALLKESLNIALRMGAIKRSDIRKVVVDATAQPKHVVYPTNVRLLHRARENPVRKAGAAEIQLRQSYAFMGAKAFQCCTGFNRSESAWKALGSLRTNVGQSARHIGRKIDGKPVPIGALKEPLRIKERVGAQRPHNVGAEHFYAVQALEVECIGKGKGSCHREFSVNVLVTTLLRKIMGMRLILQVKILPGRSRDGRTLVTILPDIERLTGEPLWLIFVDQGYKGHNPAPEYKAKVIVTGQKRNTTPAIRIKLGRRDAVEPVIGHVKNDHRMGRNYLAGSEGDTMNAVQEAAGYNFRLSFGWAKAFLCLFPVRRFLIDQNDLDRRCNPLKEWSSAGIPYNHWRRWSRKWVFARMLILTKEQVDGKNLMVTDTTSLDEHWMGTNRWCNTRKKGRLIGGTKSGLNSKLQSFSRLSGLFIYIFLGANQTNDFISTKALMDEMGKKGDYKSAGHKHYADRFWTARMDKGINSCTPPRCGGEVSIRYDARSYMNRQQSEKSFAQIKDWLLVAAIRTVVRKSTSQPVPWQQLSGFGDESCH